jgi:quercetin dioxygenase-like cupin family protein
VETAVSASPVLEDLLEPEQPSAMDRRDAALLAAGVAGAEVAATKAAIAAIAAGGTTRAEPPTNVKDRLFASFRRGGRYGVFADRIARLFDLSADDAAALMTKIEQPDAWMPFLVPGVEMIPVMAGPKCQGLATLVRFAPGAGFPAHTHRGDETMVVLDGGFVEKGGASKEVWRGDECFSVDGSDHSLVALEGVPCIAAVVIFGQADFH